MYVRVVTDRVGTLASDLDALASSFEAVAQRRVGYAGYSDVRHVEDGLQQFFGKWTDGMEKLHTQLSGLASHLHDAVAGYEGTETGIGDAASGTA